MIESISKIGDAILPEETKLELERIANMPIESEENGKIKNLDDIIEQIDRLNLTEHILYPAEKGSNVYVISVETSTGTAEFTGGEIYPIESTNDALSRKILYNDTRSNRVPPVAPTKKIGKENGKITRKKLQDAINHIITVLRKSRDKELQKSAEIVEQKITNIEESLWATINTDRKQNAIVTVRVNGKWPCEFADLRRKVLLDIIERAMVHNKAHSIQERGVCSICGKKDVPVYGFGISGAGIKVSTYDFTAFVPYNNKKLAVYVTPVCLSCFIKLRAGWTTLLAREGEFSVGGLKYMVMPSGEAREEDYEEFIESVSRPNSKFAVFSELAEAEETIEDLNTNIDMLVYRKDQAKMEVYLMEQNIPPGIFRSVRRKNRKISSILKNILKKEKKGNTIPSTVLQAYSESAAILDAAYDDENTKTKKLKELAQIIHAILREQSWPGRRYAYFTKYIEKKAHNDQTGLDHAYVYPLFAYLYFVGGDELSEDLLENIEKNFPSKAAEFAFWTGVLARHVIEMQRATGMQKGSEPFRKRIRNVRMNMHQLQRLFTEAFEKAKTYSEMLGEPWVTRTDILLEKCAKRATTADSATPDEIGFFFTVGYGLYWEVVTQNKKGGEEDGE